MARRSEAHVAPLSPRSIRYALMNLCLVSVAYLRCASLPASPRLRLRAGAELRYAS